jgi:hypothetical protein
VTTFKEWWSATLGLVPPLGWRLRDQLHDNWLRIHTLPLSKRYPETRTEWAEVAKRQKAAAAEALGGVGRPCWVVVPVYGQDVRLHRRFDDLPGLKLARGFVKVVDHRKVTFWAARTVWKPSTFKVALRAVADDRFRALWASDKGDVFAPYDGGVDLILRPPARLAEVRSKFESWLSAHPEGL